MLVLGIPQSDSVILIHIYVPIPFQILFPFRLLHNIEQSSLCHMVGSCWLSILNTASGLVQVFLLGWAAFLTSQRLRFLHGIYVTTLAFVLGGALSPSPCQP